MKRHNLLLNIVVTIIALSLSLPLVFAAQGDLSSPLPPKEKAPQEKAKEVNLELTPAVPVSPGGEKEEPAVTAPAPSEEELEEGEEELPAEMQRPEVPEETAVEKEPTGPTAAAQTKPLPPKGR
jgi:hypothetical protein